MQETALSRASSGTTQAVETLPPQPIAMETWRDKYRRTESHGLKRAEVFQEDTHARVATALAENDDAEAFEAYAKFVFGRDRLPKVRSFSDLYAWAAENGMVMAGRIQSVAGTNLLATMINCFVQPIRDTCRGTGPDGMPGIYPAVEQSGETMRRGGGVGYNFSHLRPKGAIVSSTKSRSSGPVSYMRVFGQNCSTVESAGQRRGAQMAVLNDHHPDILEFIHCKDHIRTEEDQKDPLAKFNISVNVSDELMEAAENGSVWELWHTAAPDLNCHPGAYQREDGCWVYRTMPARALLEDITETVYNGMGEPGVLFGGTVNHMNPLSYAEHIDCCNPCAEQQLPDYGCCDLGQINLTQLVRDPFTDRARLDFDTLKKVAKVLQRALDNVLDLTDWPLPEQEKEAMAKRRVGAGFIGLGSTLVMLGLKYDSEEGQAMGEKIISTMATACYEASIELAKERGSFPLLDREKHVQAPIVQRLPKHVREGILEHGLRNSHSLSIAPTGTIAIAFADNASNGIEPPFDWIYRRRVLDENGMPVLKSNVQDHAFRVWRHVGCPGSDREKVEELMAQIEEAAQRFNEMEFKNSEEATEAANETSMEIGKVTGELRELLPDYFRSSGDISVTNHLAMMEVVQPYVDSSISKTVNVPMDYPYEDFKDMYLEAHRKGLKSVAAFRPQPGGIAVLDSGRGQGKDAPPDSDDPDRVPRYTKPEGVQEAIAFPGRPHNPEGHEGRTWDIHGEKERVFLTCNSQDNVPFETLVQGAEAPRGAGVLSKLISLDMHTNDHGWVLHKLDSLSKVNGGESITVQTMDGEKLAPSPLAAIGVVIADHFRRLGIEPALQSGAVLDARLCKKEPKSPHGGSARCFDVNNPHMGDDFTIFLKEFDIDGLGRWPMSVWLSGRYPKGWDGIAKMLSLDMQVADVAWIARKLRAMLNVSEHGGEFLAPVPGGEKQKQYPSTWAYVAAILLNRYREIGLLNASGYPLGEGGSADGSNPPQAGLLCPGCGNNTLMKRDGCEVCDNCGHMGGCG